MAGMNERVASRKAQLQAAVRAQRKPLPSIAYQAGHLAADGLTVLKGAVKGHHVLCDAATREQRLALCRACDALDATGKRCTECGCFVSARTWAAELGCPLKKWAAL